MNYRRLGASGLKVSEVALGGWLTFGASVGAEEVQTLVDTAIDGGVNFIDLADVYARGEAERTFGQALSAHKRENLVISSKVYWPMSDDPNDRGLSRKHIHQSIDGSLQRIGTDYLDLYFCHRYDDETPLEEVVRAMDDLVRQGKVLYWGTSVWSSAQLADAVVTADRLGANRPQVEQPRYNMIDRHIEPAIMPTCDRFGLGLVVWSPLGQGVLTGKYNEGVPEGSRADEIEWVRENIDDEDIALARRVAPIADDLGVPMAQLALAWILRRPEISSVITGATKPGQVEENLAASALELDDETVARIEDALGNRPWSEEE